MAEKETLLIGADHAGFELKEKVKEHLASQFHFEDIGAHEFDKDDDYPDFAHELASRISVGHHKRGILICGSGEGMSIVANRYKNVRAALCWSQELAQVSREHNDANVLVLDSRYTAQTENLRILDVWLATAFSGEERHRRRLQKIDG